MASEDFDGHSDILMEGPSDPDAQATVTDFIDYTEYLPSDLVRSLTLIRGLDETYLNATGAVHELTKTYGILPTLPQESRPEPIALRKQISEHLSRAINARESAYAESCRLYDAVDRHFDRLGCIRTKLDGLLTSFPDDLAAATAARSPEAKATSDNRKAGGPTSAPKITLRFDTSRPRIQSEKASQQKGRNRGATRAERIRQPALDPDTAVPSTEHSGAEEGPTANTQLAISKKKGASQKSQNNRQPSRTSAPGGSRSVTVGGLETSTSHALSTLQPPPSDAKPGSEYMPWLRLTEWEMAKLRKKMKKNNLWQPSEIMINRELALRGRGWEGYRLAKANAELSGTKVLDCDDIAKNYVPGKLERKSETAQEGAAADETKLSNRGMKLNEAKKLKRENIAREQAALAAAEAELAAKRLGDIGSTFKSLFSNSAEQSPLNQMQNGFFGDSSLSNANGIPAKDRTKANSKKRKFEETLTADGQQQQPGESPTAVATSTTKSSARRSRPGKPGVTAPEHEGEDVPASKALLAGTGPSTSKKSASPTTTELQPGATGTRRTSAASRAQPTPTPPAARNHSQRRSLPAGPAEAPGRELRKKSATPATTGRTSLPDQAAAGSQTTTRRNRRPAPGPVTAGQDGGAAVSVGRRKAKPTPKKKKEQTPGGGTQSTKEDIRIDEDGVLEEIDPNEPRYCVCGDVSFGTMICCEDNDCDKEWFHIDCVGLSDVPSRTAKWYCPDCRKKNSVTATDGIVRSTGRR